jgi:SAM-dependent methyltransferase
MPAPSRPATTPDFWDQRYLEPGWAYGQEPNAFLRAEAGRIPPGKVLCLAEGEGRNAVHLAGLGYEVEAMDQSAHGLAKAQALAAARGVTIRTLRADLGGFDPGLACWQGIVSIFVHLPAAIRREVHQRMVRALAPGGILLLEAYSPAQLALGTGGPREPERLCSAVDLAEDFAGLVPVICRELQREILEGKYHLGLGAVVQFIGQKP